MQITIKDNRLEKLVQSYCAAVYDREADFAGFHYYEELEIQADEAGNEADSDYYSDLSASRLAGYEAAKQIIAAIESGFGTLFSLAAGRTIQLVEAEDKEAVASGKNPRRDEIISEAAAYWLTSMERQEAESAKYDEI